MATSQQPPGGDWESAGFGSRVNEIVDAVEREAAKLRQEAEQDAAQIRYQAQEEARRYIEQARRQSDELVARRTERIQELSDALMARAEEVLERLDYAVPVKAGFENLVRALGETAERLASQDYAPPAAPSWEQVRRESPAPEARPAPGYPAQAPAAEGPQTDYTATPPPSAPQQAAGAQQHPRPPSTGHAPPEPERREQAQPAAGGSAGWQQLDDAHRIAIQMAAAGNTRGEVEAQLAETPGPTRASVLDEIFGLGSPPDARVPWATPPQ